MEKLRQQKRSETPRLSCELCRERKIKCDKIDPCTNCVSAGVVCIPVQRPRLPRGVHAKRARRSSPPPPSVKSPPVAPIGMQTDPSSGNTAGVEDDLKDRIKRLEALVNSMRSPSRSPWNTDLNSLGITLSEKMASTHSTLRPTSMASPNPLWSDIKDSSEVDARNGDGLRVLGLSLSQNSLTFNCSPISLNQTTTRQLCQVYLQQVDPVIKILHRPSLERWMLQGEQYIGLPRRHPGVDALQAAVCYAAAASLTENQSWALFQLSKFSIVADSRRACDAALERTGLLASPNITALQAFVLYLIARRSEDRSSAPWTLTAVAVRLAKAIGLHQDKTNETFFSQQMRKRLWLTICLLDMQASLGQASEPLISIEEATATFSAPRHINDCDFDLNTTHDIPDREGLSDTTFSLVTYHVQLAGRTLNFGQKGTGSPSDKEKRQQHAHQFEQTVLRLLHFCDPESSQYAWFTWHGTQCLVSGARLSALRPLRRPQAHSSNTDGDASPVSQASVNNEDGPELLQLSLNILDKARMIHTDPRGEGFRWYVTIPWHALAIALAECSVCPNTSIARRAWMIVEASYRLLPTKAQGSVDEEDGIHGPLEKLMAGARERLASFGEPAIPSSELGPSSSSATSSSHTPMTIADSHSYFGLDMALTPPLAKAGPDSSLFLPFDIQGDLLLGGDIPVDLEPWQGFEDLIPQIEPDLSPGSKGFLA